jgi:hypothetical protein
MKKALDVGRRDKVAPIKKMVRPLPPVQRQRWSNRSYNLEHVIVVALLSLALGATVALYKSFLLNAVIPLLRVKTTGLIATSAVL